MTTKKICMLGLGTALYFVLSMTMKIPLIGHIQTDLGYIAFGVFLALMGPIAFLVGTIGCLLESLLVSGWVPIGWMVGQAFIGIVCGWCYTHNKNMILNIIVTIGAVLVGIVFIKSGIECYLYQIPVAIKMTKNLIAAIADIPPMVFGLWLGKTRLTKFNIA